MKYGYFDDSNKEYVIKRPDTPYPWINYLGMKNYYSLISNTAGGYSFYKDASKRRITRYRYNNIPKDMDGKYYFIYEDGDYWNPMWFPTRKKLDFYQCRHGLGYTTIQGIKNNLDCKIDYFVPVEDDCEIHRVTIENKSNIVRNIKIFSYIEFCLWDAFDDMTNYQRNYNIGEVEVKNSTIYHKSEYRERRNHFAFFNVNQKIDGFDTDRESFLGLYNSLSKPETLKKGQLNNSIASGWSPIGSHSVSLSLKPGEKKTLIFQLGYIENEPDNKWEELDIINKSKAESLIKKYNTPQKVNNSFNELKNYWDRLLNNLKVDTGDKKLNRMVNIWNQYQCNVTFNLSRSASYFESGINRGIGFRDSNQDLMSAAHMIPNKVRDRLISLAATQFEDGSAYHQYQPLTKKGNNKIGSGFNDDPLWLIFAAISYIKETGDFKILDEQVPFNNGNKASLFEHIKASFEFVINNLGPHGLPLIGHADWNDCLNLNAFSEKPDESFQTINNKNDSPAESLLIAGMFITIGPDLVDLCKLIGENEWAKKANSYIQEMKTAINKYGRDKNWFLRAYDYYGKKVGSHKNEYGQLFIEPQGFCVMGGLGLDDGFAEKALNYVKNRLDTKYGLMLLNPTYKEYKVDRGEISSYPPGYKENGGIFCHNNPWIMIAETLIGNGKRAFEYYKKLAPVYQEDKSEIRRMEPYVYSQMIAGKDAPNYGEAKNSWLTGTAAWNFIAITQWILGIRPEFKGLFIDPCIPEEWNGFTVKRKFRGDIYHIKVINKEHISKGVKNITIDGEAIEGQLVKVIGDGKKHQIIVEMGKK